MGWIMMPQLPLVAFAHMSGHLMRQFGRDPFSKRSLSLAEDLELRTTKDSQLWGLDREDCMLQKQPGRDQAAGTRYR